MLTGRGRGDPAAAARENAAMDPFTISVLFFVLVIVFLTVVFLFAGVKIVPQAEEWTVERFGRYVRTLTPGLHIITPFIEKPAAN